MRRDLSVVGISGTPKRMRENEVKKDSCSSGETFGFPYRGGSEGDRESVCGQNVQEIEGCWGGVGRQQRF